MSSPLVERLIADAWLHQQRCQGCRDCLEVCPVLDESTVSAGGLLRAMEAPDAMTAAERQFAADCTLCGQCVPACPAGARRDVMTHGLKFAAFSKSQPAPAHSFPRQWWDGLVRDVARLGERERLGRLAPLLDREAIPHARRLLWIGPAAARHPDLALGLYDFCTTLVDDLEVVAGASYPNGLAWISGSDPGVAQAAAEFLEVCREVGAEEVICAEDFDAVFFSLALEQCDEAQRPATRVHFLSDWLARPGSRLHWKESCARALYLPATLRSENAKRFPPRFYGDDLVRNYSLLDSPPTLSDGHTAVEPASARVEPLPSQILAHMRAQARRVLVVEGFSEALRLKAQADVEGGATVLLIHEALELGAVQEVPPEAEEEMIQPVALTPEIPPVVEQIFELPAVEELPVVEEEPLPTPDEEAADMPAPDLPDEPARN